MITKFLQKFKFVKLALCSNYWIWIHILGCGVLAKLFAIWNSSMIAFIGVTVIAILWEFIEAFFETPNKKSIKSLYTTVEKYKYDTAGDILAGLACAALVLF